jgi:hypothetical protein
MLTQTAPAGSLGLARLPSRYFVFLVAVVGTYLVIVEIVKRHVMRRLLPGSVA